MLFSEGGAEGGTRTPTGCPIRPSNVRVYQFHHFGTLPQRVTKNRIRMTAAVCSLRGQQAHRERLLFRKNQDRLPTYHAAYSSNRAQTALEPALLYFLGGSFLGVAGAGCSFLAALPLAVPAFTPAALVFGFGLGAGCPVAPEVGGGEVAGAVWSGAGGVTGAGCD